MNPNIQFALIAGACFAGETCAVFDGVRVPLPDYCNDLHAVYAILKRLEIPARVNATHKLGTECFCATIENVTVYSGTASEALVRATNKWAAGDATP